MRTRNGILSHAIIQSPKLASKAPAIGAISILSNVINDSLLRVACDAAEREAHISLAPIGEMQHDQIVVILVVRDYSEIIRRKAGARKFTHHPYLRSLRSVR